MVRKVWLVLPPTRLTAGQEARNGRQKCSIFINPRSRGLTEKAAMLKGYVKPLKDASGVTAAMKELY